MIKEIFYTRASSDAIKSDIHPQGSDNRNLCRRASMVELQSSLAESTVIGHLLCARHSLRSGNVAVNKMLA